MSQLPEEIARDLRYIVSESVFRFVEDRKDFVYPASVIRDKDGKVAAYEYLACHTKEETKLFYDLTEKVLAEKRRSAAISTEGAPA